MIKRYTPHKHSTDRVFVTANQYINFPELRVIDEHGGALGVMSRQNALDQARREDKDLILITDKAVPPVAKIIDLSKYKYQLSQKKAADRKKSSAVEVKEIRLTPFIGQNDLQSKMRRIDEFLKKGYHVRLSMEFRGRAIVHKDRGPELFAQVFEQINNPAVWEIEPKMMGKKLLGQIMPSKKDQKKTESNKEAEEKEELEN